jgi:hypothetical protein
MHPHRTGQIFNFDEGSLVAMRTERPHFEGGGRSSSRSTLSSPRGVGLRGRVRGDRRDVVRPGLEGTDDSRYEVTRTFYRAEGGLFVELRQEMHTVEVGTSGAPGTGRRPWGPPSACPRSGAPPRSNPACWR